MKQRTHNIRILQLQKDNAALQNTVIRLTAELDKLKGALGQAMAERDRALDRVAELERLCWNCASIKRSMAQPELIKKTYLSKAEWSVDQNDTKG